MKPTLLILAAPLLAALSMQAQTAPASSSPLFIGLGDSIGEGVQSADAAYQTQVNTYLNLIAAQMNVAFPLPLIKTGIFDTIESVTGRTRISPTVLSSDLAVSGADSTSILNEQAGTPISTETDLVLSPRTGSQISIAESLKPPLIVCWIGNNDVLGTILNFNEYNPAQIAAGITPTAVFDSNFQQISSRLGALGSKIVFANIPDVTQIGFLFSPQDLVTFLGSDYGLPQGSYTSVVAMLLIKLGLDDGSILQNSNWVLDATEVQTIHQAITTFNQSIASNAAAINAPVVDINGLFNYFQQNPPTFGTVSLSRRFLGGLFSLDGVHPSDIGHALIADAFIKTIDSYYQLKIPQISTANLVKILEADPFVDFNNDLKVRGRPGVGLIETLGPYLGVTGDTSDVTSPLINKAAGQRFMQQYFISQGRNPNTKWTEADAIAALRQLFRVK